MKRILCYGDSNTWGFDSRRTKEAGYVIRFPEHVRWTSIAADVLGSDYCILEEGLNSRTTVFDDPLEYGKKRPQKFVGQSIKEQKKWKMNHKWVNLPHEFNPPVKIDQSLQQGE